MCADLLRAILLLNLVFGYYRIPKKEGDKFWGISNGFVDVSKFLGLQKGKVKKNQIQLYHSIEDQKLSKNLKNTRKSWVLRYTPSKVV